MALFYIIGRISELSEVKSGTGKSGYQWQRMTMILETQEYGGFIKKTVFQVTGDSVDDVLQFKVGDKVKVGFSLYAREYNGRMYNNVDLVNIAPETYETHAAPAPAPAEAPVQVSDADLPF